MPEAVKWQAAQFQIFLPGDKGMATWSWYSRRSGFGQMDLEHLAYHVGPISFWIPQRINGMLHIRLETKTWVTSRSLTCQCLSLLANVYSCSQLLDSPHIDSRIELSFTWSTFPQGSDVGRHWSSSSYYAAQHTYLWSSHKALSSLWSRTMCGSRRCAKNSTSLFTIPFCQKPSLRITNHKAEWLRLSNTLIAHCSPVPSLMLSWMGSFGHFACKPSRGWGTPSVPHSWAVLLRNGSPPDISSS